MIIGDATNARLKIETAFVAMLDEASPGDRVMVTAEVKAAGVVLNLETHSATSPKAGKTLRLHFPIVSE